MDKQKLVHGILYTIFLKTTYNGITPNSQNIKKATNLYLKTKYNNWGENLTIKEIKYLINNNKKSTQDIPWRPRK